MSKYIKLIIFILVLLIISAAIVFIDSSIDNMNKFAELCASVGQVDKKPEINGRNIFMFLAPISNKK